MAARPNTKRTLEYGQRLAENHVERLDQAIEQARSVLKENRVLTVEEEKTYRESIETAKKMKQIFSKITTLTLPKGDTATPRRGRGRPSNEEIETLTKNRKRAAKRRSRRKSKKSTTAK